MSINSLGGGAFPSHLQPSQGKNLYGGNYLTFTGTDRNVADQWAQQFLPDVYEKEVEIYGNRTISSFLRMVSAEMPSTSDQIIWLEQGRLHTRYQDLVYQGASGTATTDSAAQAAIVPAGTEVFFAIKTGANADANANSNPNGSTTGTGEGDGFINFRVGQTVMIQAEGANSLTPGTGHVIKGVVSTVADDATRFGVRPYRNIPAATSAAGMTFTALAYGSEFAKGTGNFTEKLDPSYSTYSNAPIIMKEHYAINGSDTSQIGWIEVTSENGASGYLWYVKAEHENRLRWEDYQEMSMLEAVPFGSDATAVTAVDIPLRSFRSDFGDAATDGSGQNARGTEGFFHALEQRGNVYTGLAADLAYDLIALVLLS